MLLHLMLLFLRIFIFIQALFNSHKTMHAHVVIKITVWYVYCHINERKDVFSKLGIEWQGRFTPPAKSLPPPVYQLHPSDYILNI